MLIRKADYEEIAEILEIYDSARDFMAANGNPGQWTDGYPSRQLVEEDYREGRLYVCEEENTIAGVFVFFTGEEPNYREIREGAWLNDLPYGVLHRIAAVRLGRGIASACVRWCCAQCGGNLRGDTHEKNLSMQRLFEKNGFHRCGIVTVEDGTDRIAYHFGPTQS